MRLSKTHFASVYQDKKSGNNWTYFGGTRATLSCEITSIDYDVVRSGQHTAWSQLVSFQEIRAVFSSIGVKY